MTYVSAAIIRKNGKFLICQRAEGGSCSRLWEFPGGKLEPGETPEQCVIRECREELAVIIRPLGLFAETSYRYPDREIHFTFWNAEIPDGPIRMNVHRDIRWVEPDDLSKYPFCPADTAIVEKLRERPD